MARMCSKNPFSAMDKRVSLQVVTQTPDGQGGYTEAWVTVANVWADIVPVSGYERMEAMKLESPLSHKVTLRYYPGITTKHRILWEGRVLQIKEVINKDEQNVMHVLKCIEG